MSRRLRARCRAVAAMRDDGLSLIEVLVAMLMLSIVSISAAVVLVSSLRATTEQSVTQRGIAVATRALESLSSIPVPELVSGRSQTAVQDLLSDPKVAALTAQDISGVSLDAETSLGTYDPTADGTSTPVVPLRRPEQLDGVVYDVRTIINQCFLHEDTSTTPARRFCDAQLGTDGRKVYRATVYVTWGEAPCRRRCTYSVSSLIDQRLDPQFQLAQSVPIVQAVAPSSSVATSTKQIVISGVKFQNGAKLELQAGGGTLTDVVQVIGTPQAPGTANTRITATWTAGPTVGQYILTVINPDGGRANAQLLVTAPIAVDDCTSTPYGTDGNGKPYYLLFFTDNDDPAAGATATYSNASVIGSAGAGVANGRRYVAVSPGGNGVSTVDYTLTFGGLTSTSARMTFRVNAGACP